MIAFPGTLGDVLARIRRLRVRNTIAIPIVLLLLSIGTGILTAGYFINKSVFYAVFEERESNKARNIHLTIESIVAAEVKRISGVARILKNDTDITYGLFHFRGTRGDAKPLKAAMDQLFPKMNLPVFVMADANGKILYRAGRGTESEWVKPREIAAFRRVLNGEQVITASRAGEGWGIWAIVPINAFGKGKPDGVLILGSRIDDPFAKKIAAETGSQVFIATRDIVIADSYDAGKPEAFNPSLAGRSLAERKPIFHVDRERYRSYTYVPTRVVDQEFCLVIETDISVIQDLLSRNRDKMIDWGILLLTGIALIGAGFTFTLIWPLNRLYGNAVQAIREYSGGGLEAVPRGNELSTLVRANDVLLETIKNHLSERTRAEEALRETSRLLRALIEASPLAVIVCDAAGKVRVWNPAAARIFGWTEEEAIDRPNPLVFEEGNPETRSMCDLLLRGENFSNEEIRGTTRGGSEIVVAFSGAPLPDREGRIVAMMSIIADVTAAKRAEEALRRSEEHLRQSQKMEAVGKLAGGVAHDFNNLLSVITGYSELLLLRPDDRNTARREIEEIHKAGERGAALTQQLLAFSRRQVLKPKQLRLSGAVENIGSLLRRLIGENIELVTETPEDPWTVRADPGQIEQILMNLAVNARDAMPRGGKMVVSTANVELGTPFVEGKLTIPAGQYATLQIADDGSGMDEGTLSRIFEPFFTTKNPGKGTGLGLATVYGIVKQSGGYIRVRSTPGKGTTFTVYLPRATEENREMDEEPTESAPEETTDNRTILLVEDDEMVRELGVEIFRGAGYTVIEAPNGEQALSICERHEGGIDLLVTDLVMPGMNGIELARRLDVVRPGTPTLFISGYSQDAVEELGDIVKGRAFLQKPVTPTNLSRKVREILSARAAATPA